MTSSPAAGGRVRTVYLGSGAFGGPALRVLAAHPRIELVGIITAPPRPAGRSQILAPTPIAELAADLGLAPVLTPSRLRAPASVAAILARAPALAVLADYGQIVPPALLDLPHGALNLHPSALPRWRGASPIPAAIATGDPATAITLMRMDEGLDTGPVVAQEPWPLDGTETAPELEAALAGAGAALLDRMLQPWLDGEAPAVPQGQEGATMTRPLRREDGRLDPARPAIELERLVRAFLPWPGTFLELPDARLLVSAASVAATQAGDEVGAIVREGRRPALATADGRLVMETVTPPGRRAMAGEDWLRGRRDIG